MSAPGADCLCEQVVEGPGALPCTGRRSSLPPPRRRPGRPPPRRACGQRAVRAGGLSGEGAQVHEHVGQDVGAGAPGMRPAGLGSPHSPGHDTDVGRPATPPQRPDLAGHGQLTARSITRTTAMAPRPIHPSSPVSTASSAASAAASARSDPERHRGQERDQRRFPAPHFLHFAMPHSLPPQDRRYKESCPPVRGRGRTARRIAPPAGPRTALPSPARHSGVDRSSVQVGGGQSALDRRDGRVDVGRRHQRCASVADVLAELGEQPSQRRQSGRAADLAGKRSACDSGRCRQR